MEGKAAQERALIQRHGALQPLRVGGSIPLARAQSGGLQLVGIQPPGLRAVQRDGLPRDQQEGADLLHQASEGHAELLARLGVGRPIDEEGGQELAPMSPPGQGEIHQQRERFPPAERQGDPAQPHLRWPEGADA
jgi:hypothetical protein